MALNKTSQNREKGILFVVSAPSGAGKTTLCRLLLKRFPGISYSVSHTTRDPREKEKEAIDYFFITREAFQDRIKQGLWAEWAKVHGNFYGTSKAFLINKMKQGKSLLLDIDVQGAKQIMESFPEAVTLFIMAPSRAVLEERLRARGTDSGAVIQKRLDNAEAEIRMKSLYQHILVNDDLDEAALKMAAIVETALLEG